MARPVVNSQGENVIWDHQKGEWVPAPNDTRNFNPPERGPARPTYDATTWGGRKEDVQFDPQTGQYIPVKGSSGEDQDVSRYRDMARETQAGPQIDTSRSNQTRGSQMDAIRGLQDAASGKTSYGADLVNRQTRDAVAGVQSTAASVRGGAMARTAAARNAQRAGAAVTSQGAERARAVRAGEMADARGALMGATTGVREQDLGVASSQAGLDQQQRGLDAQKEATYERMAWETRNAGMGARLGRSAQEQAGASANRGLGIQDASREWENSKQNVAIGAGALAGAAGGYAKSKQKNDDDPYSDVRTKNVIPYGSLAPMMTSDKRAKMYSDDRTKLAAAWDQGRAAGLSDAQKLTARGQSPADAPAKAPGTKKVPTTPKGRNAFDDDDAYEAKLRKELGPQFKDKALLDRAISRKMIERIAGGPEEIAKAERFLAEQAKKDRSSKFAAAETEGRAKYAAANPAVPMVPPAASSRGGFMPPPDVRAAVSDERVKNVIDLDEVDPGESIDLDEPVIDLDKPQFDQRKPREASDERTASFDRSFHRGTKAEQRRDMRKHQDKAGSDADEMMASMRQRMGEGPKVSAKDKDASVPNVAMFSAMKSMEPSVYAYKPEFAAKSGQAPGELQTGPMANKMEKDPIAGMAIMREPGTGLRAIDKDKALKLTMGSLAVLANDVEQLKRKRQAKGAHK